MKPKESKQEKFYSKTIIWAILCILLILIISISLFSGKKTAVIQNSEIILGDDLRNEFLTVELKRNDSIVKLEKISKFNDNLTFKSLNGNYNFKLSLKGGNTFFIRFLISNNEPKYIYSPYDSDNSEYFRFFDKCVSAELENRIKGKQFTENELRNMTIEVKKNVRIQNLQNLGYDLKKENIKIFVQDSPCLID
ncbi:hypothetical protein [Flavobacterium daemonense]|uniref:hypothetical protein n=1 Tax=Flavobacterium daemonense TaxID=1393049 RepID=UPI001185E7A4|nr:hypothetical protein [Flavobacterium daemonense]KAF2327398.1 hypothetical protein FND99_18835 [Flavobacterium daemonense]